MLSLMNIFFYFSSSFCVFSTFLDPETRKAMGEQAVALAKAVNYITAGRDIEVVMIKTSNSLCISNTATVRCTCGLLVVSRPLFVRRARATTHLRFPKLHHS